MGAAHHPIARRFSGTLGVVVVLTGCSAGSGDRAPVVEVGRPAPAYAATALDGGPSSLEALRGRPVLLNVWATWCVPCRAEMPALEALHQKYRTGGLAVVGVSIDAAADADRVKGFARDLGVTYALWLDADDHVSGIFSAIGVPATYLIGKDGTLLWRKLGGLEVNDATLQAALKSAGL
jgi:cytochrome c biogenesis protein CcmG/thiol:disulfide interchange protein DsbE